jgi:hypothetical protein
MKSVNKNESVCNDLAMWELNAAERLLVISFRLWALPYAQPENAHPDWSDGFRSSGLDELADTLFDPLMFTLFSESLRPIRVHHAMCVGVSLDEEAFLFCVGLCQSDRGDDAAKILSGWLPPATARVAESLFRNLAEALRLAGLLLLTHSFQYSAQCSPMRRPGVGIRPGRYQVH